MASLARQATVNTVLAYVGIGLGFVNVVLLYPRVLAAEEFGLLRLLVSITAVVAQVAQLGLDNTLIRFFPYFRDPDSGHRGLPSLVLLIGLAGALVAMAVLGIFHGTFTRIFADRSNLYGLYGLYLLPLVLSEVVFILLRAYSRSLGRSVRPVFIREFGLRIGQTLLIAVQLAVEMPFSTFIAWYVAVFAAMALWLVLDIRSAGELALRSPRVRMPRRLRRSMVTYGAFTLSASLSAIVLGNLDQMMIGALLGQVALQQVAYYAVSFYFGSVISAPSRALNQPALPLLADAWKRRDMAAIDRLYGRSAMVQLVVGGFLFLCVTSGLDDLYSLLDPAYAQGREVVLLVAAANLFHIALGLNGGIITMSRNYRFDAFTSLLLLVINVVANFFLIRAMGIVGAAWATLISLVAVNLLRLWFLWSRHRLWPFRWRTLVAVGLIALVGLAVHWLPLTGSPMLDLALHVSAIALLYWPAAFVLKLTPELVAMLRRPR
ncbi:MAG: polysaccharide biosynthesis C-terminal domain-containing protein [Flavobacteriales bacterium]